MKSIKSIILNMTSPTKNYWKYYKKATSDNILKWYYLYRCLKIENKMHAQVPHKKGIHPFEMPHGLNGIFISKDAEIGENCVILHQVTIGSNSIKGSKHFGAPKIGNNVYIGAGAKIIGGITIGDNVNIGANCIVFSDIPSNSTVVMNAPRIIQR